MIYIVKLFKICLNLFDFVEMFTVEWNSETFDVVDIDPDIQFQFNEAVENCGVNSIHLSMFFGKGDEELYRQPNKKKRYTLYKDLNIP